MARKRRRHTAACKLRVPLEALEGGKTVSQRPDDRSPADERFVN